MPHVGFCRQWHVFEALSAVGLCQRGYGNIFAVSKIGQVHRLLDICALVSDLIKLSQAVGLGISWGNPWKSHIYPDRWHQNADCGRSFAEKYIAM